MHGNVYDWVADGWHKNYTNAPSDGKIWTEGADESIRVSRGGSWLYGPYGSRAAYRTDWGNDRNSNVGFRVVCV